MLLAYQIIVLASLLLFFGILLRNRLDLRPMPDHPIDDPPFVSVLVPARNEERSIERCVRSLLAQEYPRFEVIVLDDGSEDATGAILQRLAGSSGGLLRTLQGAPLAEGWHGKSWACQQLGLQASGELLLFTDADTFHRPDTLRRAVAALREGKGDMLSLTPHQELGTLAERIVVPMVYVVLLCYLPLRLVSASPLPAFCFANGQFILFRKESWQRIGGHEAVRRSLVEDVWLCMAVKRSGGRVVACNGDDAVACRMYQGLGEVWEGFSKNLFAGLGNSSIALFLFVLLSVAFYVVPPFFLFAALLSGSFTPELFWLPALQVGVALTSRFLIARLYRQPLADILMAPLSHLMLAAIGLNSFRLQKWGGGARWKGRRYIFS